MSLQRVRADWRRHLNGFGSESITFTSLDVSPIVAVVNGLAMKHHTGFDTDGQLVSSKNVHITVCEADLLDQTYPIRNAKQEVSMLKHLVSYPDSTGVSKNYLIIEQLPDETKGTITFILGDYE